MPRPSARVRRVVERVVDEGMHFGRKNSSSLMDRNCQPRNVPGSQQEVVKLQGMPDPDREPG
eukprot:7549244-Lingulodinium_polyedra.AAC.1